MDFLERFNRAIEYIEDHLADQLDYEDVAKIACCSVYNFQRMFSYMMDLPLSEYVRRRRLTLAAVELQHHHIKIMDLAIKYGYESHDSFTRAFHKMHGVTPSQARKQGAVLLSYPRISFHISVKGAEEMRYSIVDKDAFEIFGMEEIFSLTNDPTNKSVPEFWQECHANGSYEALFDAANLHKRGETYTGLCAIHAALNYRDTGRSTYPYMLFAFVTEQSNPTGYTRITVPAHKWAVFTSEEHTDSQIGYMIQQLWKRIYSEWLPASGYDKLDGPDIEIYGNAGNGTYYSEVWMPVVKK
ncbi:AraC family transcriptional regulator [Paenibacillus sp. SYP-B4298]|uniref:AraC family transcriptional regulator n=1 Tax=Paenibacillus sp. SYP-B4298 TaxID=2996034 RepID=UPI0022DE39D5|nr:AraC family transcriptional regulator [Paenibacillus sp. SYP-B4298]